MKDPEYGTTIRPDLLKALGPSEVSAEMNRGDLLLLSSYTPHGSQPNTSDMVRWSIDLRFQKTGTPTGRPFWPEFVLQSRADPGSVQDDFGEWCRRWISDLETSKGERWHRIAGDVGGTIGTKHLAQGADASAFGTAQPAGKPASSRL